MGGWRGAPGNGPSQGGWTPTIPALSFQIGSVYDDQGVDQCDYYYDYMFQDAQGVNHPLVGMVVD